MTTTTTRQWQDADGRLWDGRSVPTADGRHRVYNPTDEQLRAAGYAPYTPPEPSPEVLLEAARSAKLRAIDAYDASPAVNAFTIGGTSTWLDKATRTGLLLRLDAEAAAGLTSTTLWMDTTPVTLPVDEARRMLYAIERYASACYDRTAQHRAAVLALQTVQDIEAYDHTTGYPPHLSFGD